MKYQIKNRWDGSVIFEAEIECAADTRDDVKLGLAIRVAVSALANLAGANLEGAYLAGAYLAGANLEGANLEGVKVDGHTFRRAPVHIQDQYRILLWDGYLIIGCEKHILSEWATFDDRRILEMDGKKALDWWRKWKPILLSIAEADGRMELPKQEVFA